MNENKTGALRYFENLFLAVYFFVLLGERTASVIYAFVNADLAAAGFVWWYAHVVTALTPAAFLIVGMRDIVRIVARIFGAAVGPFAETNYRSIAYAAGVLLVGGMIHTDGTILWLQFVAYGGLLLSMLLRAIAASRTPRDGVTTGRLTVSYLYVLCFSMSIPVVYDTAIAYAAIFVPLEIVTSLLLVFAFTVMLDGYLGSGGLANFNLLTIVFTVAADVALLALRWGETINYFLLVFPLLTAIFGLIGRAMYGNHQLLWFYGYRHRRSYFEGWYFKLQKGDTVLAFIVSYHATADGRRYGMLQVVTDGEPLYFQFPIGDFAAREDRLDIAMGDSRFDESGMTLDLELNGHHVRGRIDFGKFTLLKHDIMGFFANFPLMQCKHGVVSMRHEISGGVEIDGKSYDFGGGVGYVEKDRGNSFPSDYHWTQVVDDKLSVMLAVARIPYAGIAFSGCIGTVWYEGREYRMATYNGVHIRERTAEKLVIERGKKKLTVTALSTNARPLAAPDMGEMSRTIHESPAAKVRYEFTDGGRTLFDVTSEVAGFETGE